MCPQMLGFVSLYSIGHRPFLIGGCASGWLVRSLKPHSRRIRRSACSLMGRLSGGIQRNLRIVHATY